MKLLIIFFLVLIMSTSTFAFASEEVEESHVMAEEVPLTPEGNLTLVDDVTTREETSKQFITAVTKNGNYFYLVIDRSNNKDNVYLLNMVDEADLMALVEGEPVKIEEKPVVEAPIEPVLLTPEPEKKENNILPLLILVIAVGGGGVFYYLKFIKNKTTSKNSNKNYTHLNEFAEDEFDQEEEYELDEDQ
ncbi:MAG: DUF4366 domain-containing protein [Anaerotignaceae bacterium]